MIDHFEELRRRWANALGQSGQGWLILIALHDLEKKKIDLCLLEPLRRDCRSIALSSRSKSESYRRRVLFGDTKTAPEMSSMSR